MLTKEYLMEAIEYFKKLEENQEYNKGDEIAKKAQEIDRKLKEYLKEIFNQPEFNNLTLDIIGNKWGKQGRNILSKYIWYKAFFNDFGKNYPIVINISINKNGLHCFIDINESKLNNDKSLIEKMVKITQKVLIDSNELKWDENNNYGDKAFDNIDEFEEHLKEIIETYEKSLKNINKELLNTIIEKFKIYHKEPTDSLHIKINKNGNFYKNKSEIKEKFNNFLKNPTYKNLEWWDSHINSANMQGNRTNLIKNIEDLTLEEVHNLKNEKEEEKELVKVKNTFQIIKKLIYENDNIKENLNYEEIYESIEKIEGMNATAKELAYYIQMKEDKIPLVNNMTDDVINHISTITDLYTNIEKNNLQEKINVIKKLIFNGSVNEQNEPPKYYIVDQFFNLLHKVKFDDLKQLNNDDVKELYMYAYIFSNLLGKADRKGVEKDEFLENLKKSKNIIYYGAPGTGKTYEIKENIYNIVEDFKKQCSLTQFHPSYTYEDFIEGIKPVNYDNNITLKLQDGEFRKFCDIAKNDEEKFLKENDFKNAISKYGYFFFVDEINRAELSRVFGELLYSLEYRGKEGEIKTQYSSIRDNDTKYFYIPENLFFIGTMNDVDRSIDSFDLALRRRFLWIKKECNYEVIDREIDDKKYTNACKELNKYIIKTEGMGSKYQIGHAYFLKIVNFKKKKISPVALNELFEYHLQPLIVEYLRTLYDDSEIPKKIENARKIFKLEN